MKIPSNSFSYRIPVYLILPLVCLAALLWPSTALAADDPGDTESASSSESAGVVSAEAFDAAVSESVGGAAVQRGGRDWWFGVRGGYYFDVEEPFLGVEGLFALTDISPRFYFNPNVEFVFVDNASMQTFNADFHYDLPTEGRLLVWVGAGLALIRFDPDGPRDSDNDLGGNFFAGVGSNQGTWIPYAQAKLVASDDTEFVLQFGVRF